MRSIHHARAAAISILLSCGAGCGGGTDDGERGAEDPGASHAGAGGASGGAAGEGEGGIGADTGGAGTGGASTGGASTGGVGTGGASTGGASTGGASTGGASTGGASTGGAGTGGVGTGGVGAGGVGTGGAGTGGAGTGGAGTGGVGTGGVGTGGAGTGGAGTGGAGGGGASGTGGADTGGVGTGGEGGVGTGGAGGASGGAGQDCPDSGDYVGDPSWPQALQVTEEFEFCGKFGSEGTRTLEQELAAKAKLRIPVGRYALPATPGTRDFALPVCIERAPGMAPFAFAGAGQLSTSTYVSDPYVLYTHRSAQPITALDVGTWSLEGVFEFEGVTGSDPEPLIFDGSGALDRTSRLTLTCDGDECEPWRDVWFMACSPTVGRLMRTTVTFDGGQVALSVRVVQIETTGDIAAFLEASGTLGATPFDQSSYWKLAFSAGHHLMTQDFAVLFDDPIDGACGLEVLGVGEGLPTAATVDCDLSVIAARTVTSSVTEEL